MEPVSGTLLALLHAAIATGGPFDPVASFIGLATAISNKGSATTLADLTLAPGTFATALAIATWGTPYTLDNGDWVVDGAVKKFTPGSGADDCTPVAYYVADAATAGNLRSFGLLPAGINLTFAPLKILSIVPRLTIPSGATYDVSVQWDG